MDVWRGGAHSLPTSGWFALWSVVHSTSVSLVPFTTHQSSSTDVTALFPPVTFTTYWCRSWSLEWLAQCVVPDRRKGAKTNKIDNVYLSIILLVYCSCRAIFGEGYHCEACVPRGTYSTKHREDTDRQADRLADRQTDRQIRFFFCVIGRPTSPKSMKRACGPPACQVDPHLRAAPQPSMLKQSDVVLRSSSVPQPWQARCSKRSMPARRR